MQKLILIYFRKGKQEHWESALCDVTPDPGKRLRCFPPCMRRPYEKCGNLNKNEFAKHPDGGIVTK